MLDVEDLSVAFKTSQGLLPAIENVSLRVGAGEVLGLVGESGSGKTLVALAIMGLLPPTARVTGGSVRLDGRDLLRGEAGEMHRVRGKRIAMVFQDPVASLDPVFTCGQQILEAIALHAPMPRREAHARAIALLERVRIPDPRRCMDSYPHELSGGQCQRAMIAMALIAQPDVIIADEPTTALDVTVQKEVLDLLRQLNQESGTAILLITHDLGVIYEVADRVAVLYAGNLMELAPARAIFADPFNPYTQALIDSMPAAHGKNERLAAIEGVVPPLGRRPAGCRFSDRCAHSDDHCRAERPPLGPIGGIGAAPGAEILARCWKAGQVA